MGDAVLAAEIDALGVDVLHALPGLGLGLEDRAVVSRRDARVVVEDVDSAVARDRLGVHRLHAARIGDIDADGEGVPRLGRRLLGRVVVDVGDADAGTLLAEEQRRFASHSAAGARDHANLAVETAHHVATKTFLTSE